MSSTVFQLPEELMVYNASEIHAELYKAMLGASSISLDAGKVEEIDGAGFQLLLWSRVKCQKLSKGWELVKPSEEVSNCFAQLNLPLPAGIDEEEL
ncbi:STAS domain-containing protein [Vibrio sp. JC009]|uniref:STAS domain-containing protein n=1 Tax=Vibrio sp. JC009 TaxID=2912314 RepID=UPI0023AF659B|nr:STAS domain-containing protein [Vibrio sp. JC009]WED23406.1 STAS domain-containing protein [Vibrio sp. JC009]